MDMGMGMDIGMDNWYGYGYGYGHVATIWGGGKMAPACHLRVVPRAAPPAGGAPRRRAGPPEPIPAGAGSGSRPPAPFLGR